MMGDVIQEGFWTPEPVIAYRGWTHYEEGRGLIGPHGVPWRTTKLTATHVGADHDAPSPPCNCGINAWKDPLGPRRYHILGKVALSGIVDEYEEGYRAQHAEIIEIQVYCKFESSVPPEDLLRLIESAGPFPAEKMDLSIEAHYGIRPQRVKRITWRPQNVEVERKEQSRWQK